MYELLTLKVVSLATTERGGQEDHGPAAGAGGQAAAEGEGLQEAGGGRGESPHGNTPIPSPHQGPPPPRPPHPFTPPGPSSSSSITHTERRRVVVDKSPTEHSGVTAEVQHSNKIIKL